MNKYSHFDYRINNDWLAVPLMTDIRTFRFNKTTFDICKKKGYNLHYPPPYNRKDWGTDYTKTWTWEKAFEYAEMISECTGSPGFKILGEKSEDTKFFIIICQSLGIPFFIDDYERDIKKCGLRKDDYIEKLSIVKKLFENHYIEKWLVEDDVIKWKNNPYPESLDKQPVFHLMEQNYGKFGVNGILFDIISRSEFEKDVLRSYIPGSSSFLGGSVSR
ncbi:hypothetical protein BCR36DRAFT_466412 [Piromyces finnis]|uniref:Uncharacterized protein n=1 Tax=Piromyces finnis TaxID=1754191 RepID=A0A1Y1UV11_9FUNG|nr:hypothetical protein BCR36DRAFT_466412 [Piromyces finnis]|eukprot:ORX41868.1 hypothetical protein BCR36DRAFT_466412 [Piromyces finnis]